MRIIITAATTGEWMPAFAELDNRLAENSIRFKPVFHQSGVGMLASAVSLTQAILTEKPDLVIQVGIAGCFDTNLPLGTVVVVNNEQLGDTGVLEDGKWKDIFDLKLEKSSYHPYEKRKLPNPWLKQYNLLQLPEVDAITINRITTGTDEIARLQKKYAPVIESMEGAALHYVCRETQTPFLQIRAISNYIGERDKSKWLIGESIGALNQTILQLLEKLYDLP